MCNAKKRQQGVTLTEMIVVMGILAIMGAVAVPTLARMGAFSTNPKQLAARELLNVMKAARIYAATYRVDTAVVYTLNEQEDLVEYTEPPTYVPVIDGFGLARALTKEERAEVANKLRDYIAVSDMDSFLDGVFLPVKTRTGQMQLMTKGACLPDPTTYSDYLGMEPIFLHMDEDLDGDYFNEDLDGSGSIADPVHPRPWRSTPPSTDPYMSFLDEYAFPAHIFRPTGEVYAEAGIAPRIVLEVQPSPEAPIDERYVEYESATVNEPVAPLDVQLFTLTGRVVLGS